MFITTFFNFFSFLFCIFNSIFNHIFAVQFAVLYFGAYPSSFSFQSASTAVFSGRNNVCFTVLDLLQLVLLFVYVKFLFATCNFFCPVFFFFTVFSFNPSFFSRFLPLYPRLHRCLIRRRNHYLFSAFGVRISGHKFPRMLQFYSLIMIIKLFASSEIKLNRLVV